MEESTSERNWAEQAPGPLAGYADDPPPFGGYAFMTAVFLTAFGGAMGAARASGRELPERISPQDVVLVGVASHKLSRLISKDRITSFVRAPFTEFQQRAGHAEVDERPRGRGPPSTPPRRSRTSCSSPTRPARTGPSALLRRRRGWDSNPRSASDGLQLSRLAHSTALP